MRETVDCTDLVGRAKDGDEAAFRELYSATVRSAYLTASLMLKNPDDIEDVLQNAYMKAAKNLTELRKPESFESWFRSIVENECKNYIKKEKRFRIPVLFFGSRPESNAEWKQPVPQDFMEREELREQVSRIVDSLSAEVRACIVLFHYEDRSISEISAILGIPEGTVKSRLHNGRKQIEKEFGKLLRKDPTLYGIGAVPLILSFMAYQAENVTVPAAIAEGAASAGATAAATASTAAAGASASAGAATAVTSGATAAVSAGAGTAAATIAVKAAAVAVAGCVAVGGTAAIKSQVDKKQEETTGTSSYVTTVKTEETCTVAETLTSEFTTLKELSQVVSSAISSTAVTSRRESLSYTADEETSEDTAASEKTTKKKASTTSRPSTTAAVTTKPSTTRKPTTAKPSTTAEITTEETTEEETTTRKATTKAAAKPTTTKPTTTEKPETTKEQTTSPENNYGTSGGVITEYTGSETSVSIPSKIGSQSVTAIGSGAFSGNEDIKSVSIPSSVTQIGQEAFSDCTSLSSVSLPSSLKQIGIGAFYGCSSLSSVTVPGGTTTIGDEAFAYCTSLQTVTIPSSVTSIADDAFTGCDSLTIRCEEGSAAHEFAVANGIAYTV